MKKNNGGNREPFEVGKDVVVPFLKGKGITKIDKFILTHGDTDHTGGAFAVLEEINVKEIIMPSVGIHLNGDVQIISKHLKTNSSYKRK